MKYRSYKLLQEFEQELIAQGFDDLPLEYTEQDVVPFQQLFSTWSSRFTKALVDDLRQILDDSYEVEVLNQNFVPVDDHAQGATYIYAKVNCRKGTNTVQLRVRYVVFHERILVLSSDNLNEIKDKATRKRLAKLTNKHQEPYEQFVELREL